MFLEWVDLKQLARDDSARREFQSLLQAYEEDPSRWKSTYGYNVAFNRYEYITGKVRKYVHKSLRK